MDWQDQQSQSDALTINGRFLKHYIITMERMQGTFEKSPGEGLPEFNKFVLYLKSAISDNGRVKKIEKEMIEEWARINDPEFNRQFPELGDTEKEFVKGFKVVNGCMKYVISAFNISHQGKDISGESGLLLEHYLSTMEKLQGTFAKNNNYTFNLFIYYLRSIIPDQKVVNDIDNEMREMRKSFGGGQLDNQQECEIGFKVISHCMRYLDHTMKINKRQVKILADQNDPNMPTPSGQQELSE
jgi:hypothetical protein